MDLAPDDRTQAVYKALHNLATKLLLPGNDTTPATEKGVPLAKLWDLVACGPPKETDNSASSFVQKEAKGLNNFIY